MELLAALKPSEMYPLINIFKYLKQADIKKCIFNVYFYKVDCRLKW